MNNQSHLILPVVLAAIALTGIGFAIAALVGTGSEASSSPGPQTITIKSTIQGSNTTVSKVVTHKRVLKGKVVTKNGTVTTLPGATVFGTVTTPGRNVTNTRTTTSTRTVSGPTATVFSTVTSPPVINTVSQHDHQHRDQHGRRCPEHRHRHRTLGR